MNVWGEMNGHCSMKKGWKPLDYMFYRAMVSKRVMMTCPRAVRPV